MKALPLRLLALLPCSVLSFGFLSAPVTVAAEAEATSEQGPLRVLYLDAGREEQAAAGPLHRAMEALGREGIYFDYVPGDMPVDADYVKQFDLVLERKPQDAALLRKEPVTPAQGQKVLEVSVGDSAEKVREMVLEGVPEGRRGQWDSFLKQKDKEDREYSPHVANYEKRPEVVTFQQPMTVKGSLERTQVPADMRLELFASDPDIGKPIAFAWDDRGRCWVAETRDYPHDVRPDGMGKDRITICEDTDGDGRADKFTVFAEGLNIPTGLVLVNGGVIVSQPPRFLFLKDTNGDDKADVREEIMTGWGIGDTHAQASNLHLGLDNWIYGCVGYSGYKGLVDGKEVQFTQGTFRFRPDGTGLEFLHQFTNNSWAHSANTAGDQFGGTANGAPFMYGGIPASLAPEGMRLQSAKKINVNDRAHTITPNYRQVDVFGGYTSAAGSAFIESASMPARYQGMAMVTEPTMKIIALMDVQKTGAGYTAQDAFNILASSDEWTSPVYAETGPDGAIWVADFQNYIIQHNPTPSVARGGYDAKTGVGGAHENPLRDHTRGRIYRIVWKGAKPVKKSLHGAKTGQLIAALGDDTQYWRLLAQRRLVESGDADAVPALKQLVLANDGKTAALHALWTLQGLKALDRETHQAALLAHDARLRRNAVRALGRDADAAKLFFGSGVVSDADLTTRLAAYVKLAELPTTPEVRTLVRKLSQDPVTKSDEWLQEATKLLARVHRALLYKEGPNLLPNPGFEIVGANGLPEGWQHRDYGRQPGNAGAEWRSVSGENQFKNGAQGVRVITRAEADTSLYADVDLKPNTEYRLSAWIRTHGFRGKASLNDHLGRAETTQLRRTSGWTEVDVTFNSRNRTKASINLLHVGRGDTYYDDVRLSELTPEEDTDDKVLAGDAKRGEAIFWTHPVAACMNCHVLNGKGSAVGPALDGIGGKKDADYLLRSLVDPNAELAEGYTATPISPMPPMNLILKPQEMADIMEFLKTLK